VPPNQPPPPPDSAAGREKRWSSQRKLDLVLRLLRGESLDALCRETGLPAARISEWREAFVAGGQRALKSRASEAGMATEAEKRALAKVGEFAVENELLRAKIAHMEAGLPPARRKSKR
jgi:hypothetical protein